MSILKLYFPPKYASETDLIEEMSVYTEIINSDMETIEQFLLSINGFKEIDVNFGDYIIKSHFPSGKAVTSTVSVKEDRKEFELPFIQFRNKQLAWQEFLGNIPIYKEGDKKFTKDCSIWQRLWSYDQEKNQWQILNNFDWQITRLTRDENFIYYRLKLDQGIKKPHLLQLGGKQIPWRLISLPPGSEYEVFVRPAQSQAELDNDIVAVVDNDIIVSVVSRELKNRKVEILLSYLRTGQIRQAKVIFDDIIANTLKVDPSSQSRQITPLLVSVCSYFLLKVSANDHLNEWLQGFGNSIEYLSDASVIRSQQLLCAPNPDIKLARSLLLKATELGIPIYTEGIHLLFNCLQIFNINEPKNEQLKEVLEKIRRYAASVDWSKSLTTFYGITPEKPSYKPSLLKTGIPNDEKGIFWLVEEDETLTTDFVQYNQKSLQRLGWTIEESRGEFQLMVAHSRNGRKFQEQIVRRLPENCAVSIREVILDSSDKSLYSRIEEQVGKEQPQALIVSGLDSVREIDDLLKNTNKDLPEECTFPLVLLVTDKIERKLIRLAPYFWDRATRTKFTRSHEKDVPNIA